ncbi:MAG: hypothetical protein EOO80_11980, partial [Oxalobacteraceae bacterium]
MTDAQLLATIAASTSLREGAEGVALILRTAFRDGPLLLRDLARQVRMPLPVVGAVRRELELAGLLDRGQGVELSEAGKAFCTEILGISVQKALPASLSSTPWPRSRRPASSSSR